MSVYLSEQDKQKVLEARQDGDLAVNRFWTALMSRTARRAASPGLLELGEDAEWWYPVAEYLSDAAMAYALEPCEELGIWLRDVGLSIARRSEADWVGPWYRDHDTQPAIGHLETAHLCCGLAAAIDLAPSAFSPGERDEIHEALVAKGISLCRRWLDRNTHLAKSRLLEQTNMASRRQIADGCVSEPVAPRGRLLLLERIDDVTAIASTDGNQHWTLTVDNEEPFDLVLHGKHTGISWRLTEESGRFQFLREETA